MALAAIIVTRQSVDYRRGSSNKVALAQDPFAQELAAVTPVAARREQAEQLLAKARREMKARGPAINKLLEHSVELETRLAAQEKAEKQMADAVQVAQRKVDALKAKDAKLHMTIGWPQQGGAMPTTYPAFDGASSLSDGADAASIQAAGKAIAAQYAAQHAPLAAAVEETDDEEGGPLRAGDLDNGVDAAAIRAAAAAIAQAYADRGSSIESGSADDWQGEALRPGKHQPWRGRWRWLCAGTSLWSVSHAAWHPSCALQQLMAVRPREPVVYRPPGRAGGFSVRGVTSRQKFLAGLIDKSQHVCTLMLLPVPIAPRRWRDVAARFSLSSGGGCSTRLALNQAATEPAARSACLGALARSRAYGRAGQAACSSPVQGRAGQRVHVSSSAAPLPALWPPSSPCAAVWNLTPA